MGTTGAYVLDVYCDERVRCGAPGEGPAYGQFAEATKRDAFREARRDGWRFRWNKEPVDSPWGGTPWSICPWCNRKESPDAR